MEQIDVKSRIIESMFYDSMTGELMLRFRNGQLRRFADVPKFHINEMTSAESPGEYYIRSIRDNFMPISETPALGPRLIEHLRAKFCSPFCRFGCRAPKAG